MMSLYKCAKCGFIQYFLPPVDKQECACCGEKAVMQKLTPKQVNEYRKHVKSMSYVEVNGNCRADEVGHFRPA